MFPYNMGRRGGRAKGTAPAQKTNQETHASPDLFFAPTSGTPCRGCLTWAPPHWQTFFLNISFFNYSVTTIALAYKG